MKKLLLSFAIVCSLTACDLFKGGLIGDFAGGDGTPNNPYKIKTASHLLNISKHPDAYFILGDDIDMSDVVWIPCELATGFDGNNHTIYNLTITENKSAEGQGMFTELGKRAYVKNLTLHNVICNLPYCDNVGAIAGKSNFATIENCHVILLKPNAIYGNNAVGGMVGNAIFGLTIKNSSVIATTDKHAIVGTAEVGGMVGYLEGGASNYAYEITNNHIKANIDALSRGGGFAGYVRAYKDSKYTHLSYEGTITVEPKGNSSTNWGFGGIIGEGHWVTLENCKANVNIYLKDKKRYVGGLLGYADLCNIIACYTLGAINIENITYSYDDEIKLTPFIGIAQNGSNKVYDSYTLMDISIDEDCWAGINNFAIHNLSTKSGNTINLATIMRASKAENANLWNFNNTYSWTGQVNSKNVTVTCPKMIWE